MPRRHKNKNSTSGSSNNRGSGQSSNNQQEDINVANTSENIEANDVLAINSNQTVSNNALINEIENLTISENAGEIGTETTLPVGEQNYNSKTTEPESIKKFKNLNLNVNISKTMQMKFLPERPDKGGTKGRQIQLIVNCFNLNVKSTKIFMYDIELIKAELVLDDNVRDFTNRIKRKDIFRDVVSQFLKDKCGLPIFDGGRIIFNNQLLPYKETINKLIFIYNYEDQNITCHLNLQLVNSNIELDLINDYIHSGKGRSNNLPQECIRVLDLIIREMLINCDLILIGNKGIFNPRTSKQLDKDPYTILSGYFSTIRPHMSNIRFNLDTTQIVCHQAINMKDYIQRVFTLNSFNLQNKRHIDSRIFNIKVKASHYKNDKGENYTRIFTVKGVYQKNANNEMIENLGKSINEYFLSTYGINLKYPELLLIETTNYNKFPVELLTIVPNQKVMGNDPNIVREVIKHSAIPCTERFDNLKNSVVAFKGFRNNKYLQNYNISINPQMITVKGRILDEPTALFGGKEEKLPKSKFNLTNKRFKDPFHEPIKWALFAFGDRRDYGNERELYALEDELPKAARKVNVTILNDNKFLYVSNDDIKKSIEKIKEDLDLLVVVVRNDVEYKLVKDIGDIELGIVTQCISYENLCRQKNLSQYMGNLMLKINAKLGGVNWEIKNIEYAPIKGLFMVFGIDVTHPSNNDGLSKSVAAVVGSINKTATIYSAIIKKQLSKDGRDAVEIVVEMEDMVYRLIKVFHDLNHSKLPEHLIFYRDGVSEGQFEIVFNHEITAIQYACEKLEKNYKPKITYIIVQKRHNIRFCPFTLEDSVGRCKNVPPGVVIDHDITHSREFDFYLCSHEGIQGTSKPVHYYVILDENKWSSNDLQEFTYFLCYVCFRCTRSISYPAPTHYAHLAAFRGRILKDDEDSMSLTSENENSNIPDISINEFHQNKMFFI